LLSGNKEQQQYERTVRDVTDLLKGLVQKLKSSKPDSLNKKQSILRHFSTHDLIINRFAKHINY
jgi:hypothetical protein